MNNAIYFSIPGECVPYARSGANGKIRFTPKRQRDFMCLVKLAASKVMNDDPPFEGPLKICVRATYLTPKSWSKSKRQNTYWKTSKPDASNLLKLVEDALNGVAFLDDAQIVEATVQKTYAPIAQTIVEISELKDDRQRPIISA